MLATRVVLTCEERYIEKFVAKLGVVGRGDGGRERDILHQRT